MARVSLAIVFAIIIFIKMFYIIYKRKIKEDI